MSEVYRSPGMAPRRRRAASDSSGADQGRDVELLDVSLASRSPLAGCVQLLGGMILFTHASL
jgi:hypothetical protein